MKISLIGMSNTGKSYWADRLQAAGFIRFCCDDLIEKELGPELEQLGYSGIQDVSRWMGQPYDPQYSQTSQEYLDFERGVMQVALDAVKDAPSTKNIVIDTTGSVIYTGDATLRKLTQLTRVVYLEAPESVQAELYRKYLEQPKPVIWGNGFTKLERESDLDALKRCYPQLLKSRATQYEPIADVTLDYAVLRQADVTAADFLGLVSQPNPRTVNR